jgi:hypothetical protein
MAIGSLLGWFKTIIDRPLPPVSRQGKDTVRIVLRGKKVTLQGERMSDKDGAYILVSFPLSCFWDFPAGESVNQEEREAILDLLQDKKNWLPGERFEVFS